MNATGPQYEWDVFLSHAAEDKAPFVRDLAAALRLRGLKIWFDEQVLRVGDSLRRSIDTGLRNSRFGIVILSAHFFSKEWPRKELDALISREDGREKVILPVWHDITYEDVRLQSPLLADKIALSSSQGTETLASAICAIVAGEERKYTANARRAWNAASFEKLAAHSGSEEVALQYRLPVFLDAEVGKVHEAEYEPEGDVAATALAATSIMACLYGTSRRAFRVSTPRFSGAWNETLEGRYSYLSFQAALSGAEKNVRNRPYDSFFLTLTPDALEVDLFRKGSFYPKIPSPRDDDIYPATKEIDPAEYKISARQLRRAVREVFAAVSRTSRLSFSGFHLLFNGDGPSWKLRTRLFWR